MKNKNFFNGMLKTGFVSISMVSMLMANNIQNVKNNIQESMKGPLKLELGNNPYKDKILNSMKVEFLGIKKVKDLNNAYIAFLRIVFAGNEKYLAVLAFKDGKIVVPLNSMTFLTKNGIYKNPELKKLIESVKNKALKIQNEKLKAQAEKFIKVFNAKKDAYFVLSSGHKKTVVMFLDPNCPFCVRKLRTGELSNIAKNKNVVIVFTPLVTLNKNGQVNKRNSLHPPALHIADLILKNEKNKKTIAEKIKVLSKYMYPYNPYNPQFKFKDEKENKEIRKKLVNTINKYINSGMVRGTPTEYNLDEKQTKELFKKINKKD